MRPACRIFSRGPAAGNLRHALGVFRMIVWCGLSAAQLGDEQPDLIVFPEGVDRAEIDMATALRPNAIVAGAVLEACDHDVRGRMRGIIRHLGRDWINYQKVRDDNHTAGGPAPKAPPVYETDTLAVGLLICMDINATDVRDQVMCKLRQSPARFKVLCIPADMHMSVWSMEAMLQNTFLAGAHLALSNHTTRYAEFSFPSFIADEPRVNTKVRDGEEPIRLELNSAQ